MAKSWFVPIITSITINMPDPVYIGIKLSMRILCNIAVVYLQRHSHVYDVTLAFFICLVTYIDWLIWRCPRESAVLGLCLILHIVIYKYSQCQHEILTEYFTQLWKNKNPILHK
jgi:hypothetical protein